MSTHEEPDLSAGKAGCDAFEHMSPDEREAIEATLGFIEAETVRRRQAWLRRAHAGILVLIVVAVAPFLWRAVQGVSIPPNDPVHVPADRLDGGALLSDDLGEEALPAESDTLEREPEPYASLDEDLPSPSVTMRATQHAFADAAAAYRDSGFLGWLGATQNCYDRLDRADVEQRIYCLQLDAAAYSMERAVPESFQAADAEHNPYFTRDVFMERQLAFAPPNNPALSADAQHRRKREVLTALAIMLDTAHERALAQDGVAPTPPK